MIKKMLSCLIVCTLLVSYFSIVPVKADDLTGTGLVDLYKEDEYKEYPEENFQQTINIIKNQHGTKARTITVPASGMTVYDFLRKDVQPGDTLKFENIRCEQDNKIKNGAEIVAWKITSIEYVASMFSPEKVKATSEKVVGTKWKTYTDTAYGYDSGIPSIEVIIHAVSTYVLDYGHPGDYRNAGFVDSKGKALLLSNYDNNGMCSYQYMNLPLERLYADKNSPNVIADSSVEIYPISFRVGQFSAKAKPTKYAKAQGCPVNTKGYAKEVWTYEDSYRESLAYTNIPLQASPNGKLSYVNWNENKAGLRYELEFRVDADLFRKKEQEGEGAAVKCIYAEKDRDTYLKNINKYLLLDKELFEIYKDYIAFPKGWKVNPAKAKFPTVVTDKESEYYNRD